MTCGTGPWPSRQAGSRPASQPLDSHGLGQRHQVGQAANTLKTNRLNGSSAVQRSNAMGDSTTSSVGWVVTAYALSRAGPNRQAVDARARPTRLGALRPHCASGVSNALIGKLAVRRHGGGVRSRCNTGALAAQGLGAVSTSSRASHDIACAAVLPHIVTDA